MTSQDKIFLEYEGNNWFKRNVNCIIDASRNDLILKMIDLYEIIPKNVLEIGACNGFRLNEIHKKYGSNCTAVEPSELAIEDGKNRYPNIVFYKGIASELPFDDKSKFDMIIINFVFHWISREKLFKAVSEIDRVLSDNGILIIGDFMPDSPVKVNYHHVKDEQMWTYKQDYSRLFTCSNLYTSVGFITGHHETKELDPDADSMSRISVSILRKNYDAYTEMKFKAEGAR